MREYEVAFEIAGPAAMFTRPDTGSTPISYPMPTFSAAKGMFDAVLWRPHVYVQPTRVEICRPVRYERYVTNYGGPLRKGKDISGKKQLSAYGHHTRGRVLSHSWRGTDETNEHARQGQDTVAPSAWAGLAASV